MSDTNDEFLEDFTEEDFSLKSVIGEHDFNKKPCSEYCPLYKTSTCPINKGDGPFSCWGDLSGFEHDLMPRNIIGPGGPTESLYDISKRAIDHKYLQLSEWNAWVEKFQCDYRFGQVSDTNAQGILFPNVDNPWMFTEYVFQGVGDDSSSKIKWDIPPEYIIQPPIYNPETLTLINGDVDEELIKSIEKYNNEDYSESEDKKKKYKQFRKIQSWDALFSNNKNQYHKEPNEGVKLYRAKIPVQSIKWGEHGNVPPHTIDMTAPKNWFNPDESELQFKVVYDAVVGTSLRAPDNRTIGVVMWCTQVHDVYIQKVQFIQSWEKDTTKKQTIFYKFEYPATYVDMQALQQDVNIKVSVTFLNTPKYVSNGLKKAKEPTLKLMGVPGTQYVYTGGCSYLYSTGPDASQHGTLRCRYFQNIQNLNQVYGTYKDYDTGKVYENITYLELFKIIFVCNNNIDEKTKNCLYINSCPFFHRKQSLPIIASYQAPVPSVQQVTFNAGAAAAMSAGSMMMAAMGGVAATSIAIGTAFLAFDYVAGKAMEISASCNRSQMEISYNARYILEQSSKNVIKLNKKKYNEFGQDVQIVPGTGKFVFQQVSHFPSVIKGDSILYNDISTLSFHRLFTSVMHCATQKSCNFIVGPISHTSGFKAGKRTGQDGKCFYYNNGGFALISKGGCPYNCVSKRGYQFAKVMQDVENILQPYISTYTQSTSFCAWNFKAGEVFNDTLGLYKRRTWKNNQWLIFKNFAVCQQTDNIAVFAFNTKGSDFGITEKFQTQSIDYSEQLGGIAIVASDYAPPGYALFAKIKTECAKKEVNKIICKEYSCKQKFVWYCPFTNNYEKLNKYHKEKFISDSILNSVSHENFKNDIDDSNLNTDTSSSQEISDKKPLQNVLPILQQTIDKNGYWFCKVDENFILPKSNCMMIDNEEKFVGGWHPEYKDYSKMGGEFMQDVAADWERQGQGMGDYVHGAGYKPIPMPVNKKGYWIDQSGEYILKELSTGVDSVIASERERENVGGGHGICISFKKSNTQFNSETGESIQPMTMNGAVYSNDSLALVQNYREQKKPQFNHPNKNETYYAPLNVNNIDMLPTRRQAIYCSKCDYYLSEKYLDLKKCPWCHQPMQKITGAGIKEPLEGQNWKETDSVIKKFFKLYSLGIVDVWDVPGSSIKTDAYFWRHQTQVTNAIRRQLYHKLGMPENGSYKSDNNSPKSQQTMGLPEGTGFFQEYDGKWGSMINYHMPPNYLPNLRIINEEKQNIINPYSNSGVSQSGLKMLSLAQMIALRNMVQPIFAYTRDIDSSDYFNKRASYYNRQVRDQPIIWQGRKALVPTQVLAYTSDGNDSYQEYFSGDYVYGQTREFFPSGCTWWNMKGVIGGRDTLLQGGKFHMDDKSLPHGYMDGGSGGMYTVGNKTVAKCAISIHGLLPLNKQIVAAYLITSSNGIDPSRDPVGLTWTGGPPMYHHYHAKKEQHFSDGIERHFHGTAGYLDIMFDENGRQIDASFNTPGLLNMFNEFNGMNIIIQAYRNTRLSKKFMDQSQHSLYGIYNNKLEENVFVYYDDQFIDVMENMSAVYDFSFYKNVGTPKKIIYSLNENNKEVYYGYDETSFANPYGFSLSQYHSISDDKKKKMFQYLMLNSDDDLVIKYPNSQIWKEVVKQDLEYEIKKNTAIVEFGASDGTEQNYVSTIFTQTDHSLYGDLIPRQSQGISGYFDMTWTNTKGYVYNQYGVQSNKKINWDAPVIFQAGDEANTKQINIPSNYGFGERTLDVTKIVKSLYNDRVDRNFGCKAGTKLEDIINWEFYKTQGYYDAEATKEEMEKKLKDAEENLNSALAKLEKLEDSSTSKPQEKKKLEDQIEQAEKMVDDAKKDAENPPSDKRIYTMDEDVKKQNYQEGMDKKYGYILNDTFSYPEMDDLKIPQIDGEGDKYQFSPLQAPIVITFTKSEIEITDTCCNYCIVCDGQTKEEKTLKTGKVPMSGFHGLVMELFNALPPIKNSSNNSGEAQTKKTSTVPIVERLDSMNFRVISKESIIIYPVQHSCYGLLGITLEKNNPLIIMPSQIKRVLSSSNDVNSLCGYPQTSLLYGSTNHWKYKLFDNKSQSVVLDLARVPLCKQQRNWRNKQPWFDYSNCYCQWHDCICSQSRKELTIAQAANIKGKYFDKTSNRCPICGWWIQTANGIPHAGDNTMTYFYDNLFAPSPFILKIEFILDNDKGNFSISTRSSQDEQWFTIVTGNNGNMLIYNGEGDYITITYKKEVKIQLPQGKIRGRFIQIEVGCEVAYEYKQLEVCTRTNSQGIPTYENLGFNGYFLTCFPDSDYNRMSQNNLLEKYAVVGTFDNDIPTLEKFRSEIKRVYSIFESSSSGTETNNQSSSSSTVSPYTVYWEKGEKKEMGGYAVKVTTSTYSFYKDSPIYLLGLDRVFPQKDLGQPQSSKINPKQSKQYVKFYIASYKGGISNLKINGCHYKTEQSDNVNNTDSGEKYLTITDPPDEYKILLRQQQYSYQLPFRPVKILSVLAGTDDFGGYILKEIVNFSQQQPSQNSSSSSSSSSSQSGELPNNLRWTTDEITITGNDIIYNEKKFKIKKIKYGQYHYDPKSNKIYIPQIDQKGNKFIDFQKDLKMSLVSTNYMPTCIKIKYWAANGKSITFTAQACGHGPSYMVEKGAINQIVKGNFPNNGKSGLILDPDGKVVNNVPISWQVTNNIPATLDIEKQSKSQTSPAYHVQWNSGQFRINLSPTSLNSCPNRQEDEAFVQLYGENCEGCMGVCTTELTFFGAPDQILSGYIQATAPAITSRTVNVGNGIEYTYTQKTGGIKKGLIIAQCKVSQAGSGRMTKCYNVPKLIIYAKDIDPFGDENNNGNKN